MRPIVGKVAIVAGASRGLRKGAALGLAEVGATPTIPAPGRNPLRWRQFHEPSDLLFRIASGRK